MPTTITTALSTIMNDLEQALNQTTCYQATSDHNELIVRVNVKELTRTIGTWSLTWNYSGDDTYYERSIEFRTDDTIVYYDNVLFYGTTITSKQAIEMLDPPFEPWDDGCTTYYDPMTTKLTANDSNTAVNNTASLLDLIIALASLTELNGKKGRERHHTAIPTRLVWIF